MSITSTASKAKEAAAPSDFENTMVLAFDLLAKYAADSARKANNHPLGLKVAADLTKSADAIQDRKPLPVKTLRADYRRLNNVNWGESPNPFHDGYGLAALIDALLIKYEVES
jgi:hypothetical protein